MSKVYTAQEMREMADKLDDDHGEYAICHYDERDDEWRPLWMKPNSVVLALRQAADMIECEKKREKKYEYALKGASGRVSYTRFPDVLTAHSRALPDDTIVRHRVGEWEEVAE